MIRRRRAQPISSVLAPPETKEETQALPESSSQKLWSAFSTAGQLISGLRLWPAVGQEGEEQAAQVQEALREASRAQSEHSKMLPDITGFLTACDEQELKHLRMLVSLCGLTYYMGTKVTPRGIARRHKLELVSTSLCCERVVYEHSATAEETLLEGDGMAVSLPQAVEQYKATARAKRLPPGLEAASPNSNIVPFHKGIGAPISSSGIAESSAGKSLQPPQEPDPPRQRDDVTPPAASAKQPQPQPGQQHAWRSPADAVTAKLSEAAAAASAAALQPLASAADSLSSAAGTLYSGGLTFMSGLSVAAGGALAAPPLLDRVVAAAVSRVASAEVASAAARNSADIKAASASAGRGACPSEWFVADEPSSRTRYFVIQGSDSLEHWRVNINFEPVPFESAELGIKVHRGAYEAALVLYDRFLPLVHEHLDSHPFARVCFVGHSIGGSLATLLLLMFRRRGVLTPSQAAPAVTFGAPAVFCEAATGCGCSACSSCCAGAASAACQVQAGQAPPPSVGLLRTLGLRPDSVRNVIMARDIVPRAFACDYSLVADILKSWGPNWRDHRCLSREGRKQMYHFVGTMHVLQPPGELTFVAGDGYHPMLPAAGGLYAMRRPKLAEAMRGAGGVGGAARPQAVPHGSGHTGRASGSDASPDLRRGDDAGSAPGQAGLTVAARQPGATVVLMEVATMPMPHGVADALALLMDCPHPLETLGDPGAYFDYGSISRYHNPDNYCRALGAIAASKRVSGARHGGNAAALPAGAPEQQQRR